MDIELTHCILNMLPVLCLAVPVLFSGVAAFLEAVPAAIGTRLKAEVKAPVDLDSAGAAAADAGAGSALAAHGYSSISSGYSPVSNCA